VADCIEWTGSLDRAGYGKLWASRGRTTLVHRQVMEDHLGRRLGRWEIVRHTCDNPSCVNLDHLRLGTQGDNIRDMHAKGRSWQRRSEVCPKCGGEYVEQVCSDGTRRRRCPPCHREVVRVYGQQHRENGRERMRAYRLRKKATL
jgi:hypothetical protein